MKLLLSLVVVSLLAAAWVSIRIS
jgi:hypothetical protein